MSFAQRLSGVFFDPKNTFTRLAAKPVWVDVLIFLVVVGVIYSYLIAPFMQKDTIAMMKDNVRLKELMGEERYNARLRQLENPSTSTKYLNLFLISPVMLLVGIFLSSVVLLVFGRFFSSQGNYRQVLAAFLHASLVDKLLGNALRLFLVMMKKSVFQTSTSLALIFPSLSFTSPAYVVLSQVDFFQLWLCGVLSFGLAELFKISSKKALLISYGFWLLKSLLSIGFGLINLKFLNQ